MSSETEPATGVVDCQTCGSCCVGTTGGHMVVLSQDDIDRIPMLYAERHLEMWGDKVVIKRRKHADGDACAFFFGRVYGRARCMIYDYRPDTCRGFGRGGRCEGWLIYSAWRGRPYPDGVEWDDIVEAAMDSSYPLGNPNEPTYPRVTECETPGNEARLKGETMEFEKTEDQKHAIATIFLEVEVNEEHVLGATMIARQALGQSATREDVERILVEQARIHAATSADTFHRGKEARNQTRKIVAELFPELKDTDEIKRYEPKTSA